MTWNRVLTTWLERQLGAPVELSEVQAPQHAGWSHHTVSLRATCRDATLDLVVRAVPPGTGLFEHYDVAAEAAVLRFVQESSDLAPPPRWVETDMSVLGAAFMVMPRLAGRVPPAVPNYMQSGWLHDASATEQTRFWWAAIDALATVHRLSPPSTLALPALFERWQGYLEWLHQAEPPLEPAERRLLDTAWAWLAARRPTPGAAVLLHGDFQPPNTLWNGERLVLLDWELAARGEAEHDLAVWLLADRYFSEGAGVWRLPGFPTPAATIARYEERSGRTLHHPEWHAGLALFKAVAPRLRFTALARAAGTVPPGFVVMADPCVRWLAEIIE